MSVFSSVTSVLARYSASVNTVIVSFSSGIITAYSLISSRSTLVSVSTVFVIFVALESLVTPLVPSLYVLMVCTFSQWIFLIGVLNTLVTTAYSLIVVPLFSSTTELVSLVIVVVPRCTTTPLVFLYSVLTRVTF